MGVDGCANYFDFATAATIQAAINLALGHGHWILRNDIGEQARKAALPLRFYSTAGEIGARPFCGSASYIEQCCGAAGVLSHWRAKGAERAMGNRRSGGHGRLGSRGTAKSGSAWGSTRRIATPVT
jgi:hypothetical protein